MYIIKVANGYARLYLTPWLATCMISLMLQTDIKILYFILCLIFLW